MASTKATQAQAQSEDVFPQLENFSKYYSKNKQNLKKNYEILEKEYHSNEERCAFLQKIIDNDDFKPLHREAKKHQKSLIKENKNILDFVEKNSSEKKKSTKKSPEMLYKHSTGTFFAEKSDPQHWNNQSDEEKNRWESLSQLWNNQDEKTKLSIVNERKEKGKLSAMKAWINEHISSSQSAPEEKKSSKKASKKAKEPKPPSAPKKKNGGRVSKTKKAKAKK